MLKYIFKRILMMVPVLIGISFVIFSILYLTPGDPAREILGPTAPQSTVDTLREEMGLNDGLFKQYGRYMWNVLQGKFGNSYQTQQSVTGELIRRLPVTVTVAVGATVLSILVGIPLGILSAVKQYSLADSVSMVFSMVFASMPTFWLGLLLMLLFSLRLGWLPAAGSETIASYFMPWVALGAHGAATLTRMTRSSMLEVIRQDYIRTAKAKGLSYRRVVTKHALKNSMLPVITVIGTQLIVRLGGSVVIESVFSLAGLGTMVISGIKTKDTPIVMISIFAIAVIGGVMNLMVDVLYAYIDPRIKTQYLKTKRRRTAA